MTDRTKLVERTGDTCRQLGQVNVAGGSSPEPAQAAVACGEAQGAATETEDEKMIIDLLFMGMKSMGVFDETRKHNQPSSGIPGATVQRTGGASMLLKK